MRVKKLQESDRRGGKEVLSRQGKIFRWTVSILLIIYTSIAIFVTVVADGFGKNQERSSEKLYCHSHQHHL